FLSSTAKFSYPIHSPTLLLSLFSYSYANHRDLHFSLHDALPISNPATYTGLFTFIRDLFAMMPDAKARGFKPGRLNPRALASGIDRKSTRLNSSHSQISYAVFCLKKKKKNTHT